MAPDLATRAELVKLARALHTSPDRVAFAASLGPAGIRRLRERVVTALYDEHRAAFQRVAAISRVLPTPLNVRIALRAFSPLLAARVAGEMAPERAAELANRMPIEYLAQACVHLDPRRAVPVVARIRPDRAVAVVLALVAREEFITLGRLLEAATARIVEDVTNRVSDEAVLWIGCYAESDEHLTRVFTALPAERVRGVVHTALTGPAELRLAGLAMIGRLTDDRFRNRVADHAAEADDDVLTRMLTTAVEVGGLTELATAVDAMSEPARRRVLELPVLAEHETLRRHLLGR
ncbi:hypothetical protein [Actinophytocola xanthii]|uniref:Uncharacterized protein n=1 Tax=Actinophytocola xanthii TaxID=1912961 RepID=A0A1Q8C1K3_9PSEU|nr:hypothetical protein [Actinophytocola xanthii]OLF08235.1 hypothetical protein BU204_34735 [Actinophytocola xanthii]